MPPSDSAPMPPDFSSAMGKRLAIAALAASAAWTGYLGLAYVRGTATAVVFVIGWTVICISLVLAAYSRRTAANRDRITSLGSLYLLGTAFAVAAVEYLSGAHIGSTHIVSYNAVWIAFFPMLVPCAPKKTLIKSTVAATMNPVALALIVTTTDVAWPSTSDIAWLFLPVYGSALLAYVSAGVMTRLGAQASKATRLGTYELVERIGLGGMGEVWRARHDLLARPAAIKLIRSDQGDGTPVRDEQMVRRFEREAQTTASLKSPHTVQLYDFGVTDSGTFYYVMEMLEGGTLEQLVENTGPLPPARAVHIVRQALDSLAEAHSYGLVHRDIKPANVHVGQRGLIEDYVKVLDFGLVKLARAHETRGSVMVSKENQITGTPAYLAPEALTGAAPVDARTDLYAVGCMLHWMLTGRLAFSGDTPMKMAIAHVTETPEPPSAYSSHHIPAELDELVLACLEKDPEDRPASAIELSQRLASIALPDSRPDSQSEPWNTPSLPPAPERDRDRVHATRMH